MSTPARVKLLAKEFEGLSDSVIQEYLTIVDAIIDTAAFGSRVGTAKAYLAAHLMKVSESNGLGDITSENNGAISRSYSANTIDNQELSSTSYGRLYLALQRGNISSPIIV